ncbi:hypothetical protein BDK51DRAFT_11746, partial [Blyttiomyces helicus]
MGLEYTFGRRTRGVNAVKDVTNIWELAGGTFLSDLIQVPITESNVHTSTFVIVLDLSKPSEVLNTLEHFLQKIEARVAAILAGLEARGSRRPRALKAHAWKRFGVDHPDKDSLDPILVPLVIIGSKFDLLKDEEPEKRRVLSKTLRFVAHTRGASLIFVSQKDENISAKCRQILNHHAFRGSPLKGVSFDHNKHIYVMAAGNPPSPPRAPIEAKQAVLDLSKYPEQAVDAMRVQKELSDPSPLPPSRADELETLRRAGERKSKERDFMASLTGMGSGTLTERGSKKNGKAYSRARAAGMA